MKFKYLPFLVLALFVSVVSFSQTTTEKDSVHLAKSHKEIQKLEKNLEQGRAKLLKLEASLSEKIRDSESATEESKRSSDYNAEIAAKLNDDHSDKRLARKSRKAANEAEKDAKRARIAKSNLESLQGDLESARKKVAEYEEKLIKARLAINSPTE